MIAAPRYNAQGEKVGEVTLEPKMFEVAANTRLLHQAVMIQQGNARAPIAHTKTRGEVRGGGKKPWRQKGTGRARHGSIRSPIWRGGGITFGPRRTRNFQRALPIKARRKAMFMALSDKARHQQVAVVEAPKLESPKTKVLTTLFKKVGLKEPMLIVLPSAQAELIRSARNAPALTTIGAASLNVVDILKHRSLVLLDGAPDVMRKTFLN